MVLGVEIVCEKGAVRLFVNDLMGIMGIVMAFLAGFLLGRLTWKSGSESESRRSRNENGDGGSERGRSRSGYGSSGGERDRSRSEYGWSEKGVDEVRRMYEGAYEGHRGREKGRANRGERNYEMREGLQEREGFGSDEKREGWMERREKKIPLGWSIGSPAAGEVSYFHEGSVRGAMIVPQQGLLYAPVAGKIVRLYPTGNAMRLRTDYGIELLIQAGIRTAELEGRYYRPRIVQNEIVGKGKLLLEYDIEGIQEEGYDPAILISVVDAQNYEDVTAYDVESVKVGENLMWVRR